MMKISGERGDIESKLSAVAGVSAARITESSGNWHSARVIAEGKEDIGEPLFKCVVANGWSLAELRRERVSLEDVFTQLTRG